METMKLEFNENESVEKNLGKAFATLAANSSRRGFEAMKLRALEILAKVKMRFDGDSDDERGAAEFAVKMYRGAVMDAIASVEFPETVVLTSLETDDGEEGPNDAEGGAETPESQAEAEAAR